MWPSAMTVTLDFQGEILKKISVIGMGWQIDMEKTGFELIGCWTHVVTLNFDLRDDLDLVFSR